MPAAPKAISVTENTCRCSLSSSILSMRVLNSQSCVISDHQLRADCYVGAIFTVDADNYPDFFDVIRPLICKALLLTVFSQRFPLHHHVMSDYRALIPDYSRQSGPTSPSPPRPNRRQEENKADRTPSVPSSTPGHINPTPNIENRLRRLQVGFGQLVPQLVAVTTGLNQLKDSVGLIKRKLCTQKSKSSPYIIMYKRIKRTVVSMYV